MDPNAKVIECLIQVAAPRDHVGDFLAGGVILGVVLAVTLGIVLFNWIEKRDTGRDAELRFVKNELAHLVKWKQAQTSLGEV